MKQVYPHLKRSQPLPFPLENCSFPWSGLSDLATLGQTTVRSRKRKVLSRKRKLGLELFYLRYTCFRPYRTFIPFHALNIKKHNFSWISKDNSFLFILHQRVILISRAEQIYALWFLELHAKQSNRIIKFLTTQPSFLLFWRFYNSLISNDRLIALKHTNYQ